MLVLAACGVLYGPQLRDTILASQFTPSSQLASVDSRIQLTARGQQIFYATHPMIEDKSQFNKNCQSTERTAAILGCYVDDRIHLYNIQNAELDGALEVTAAHELLHAAYQRLNVFDRNHVNAMIADEYAKIKDQANIKEVMSYYSQAEPGDEVNELHSIIGTTVSDLSPQLERYYGQYFIKRSTIVALNTQYNTVFNSIEQQAEGLQKSLTSEQVQLAKAIAAYNADLQQLNADIKSFNEQVQTHTVSSQATDFTAARSLLVDRTEQLVVKRVALNARIATYNANIQTLNGLSVRVNELNESMNGVSAPGGV